MIDFEKLSKDIEADRAAWERRSRSEWMGVLDWGLGLLAIYAFLLLLAGMTLTGCADKAAQQQHMEMVRVACDNGQPSACIELQDAYATRRSDRAQARAYLLHQLQQ